MIRINKFFFFNVDHDKNLKDCLSNERDLLLTMPDFDPSRYEIFQDPYGSGGFCTVLKAWDKKRAKFVAIKCYSGYCEGFITEMIANNKLPNTVKHVVKLSQYYKRISGLKAKPYEYLLVYEAGVCDLNDLREERLKLKAYYTEKELLQIITDVSKGLCELRKAGIIHRDLKERNIVYSRCPSRYMLIDLNVSAVDNGKELGKTEYYENSNIDNNDYDIWCLGVTILNLINLDIVKNFDQFKKDKQFARNCFRNILNSSNRIKFSKEFATLLSAMLNLEAYFPGLEEVMTKQAEISEKLASESIIKEDIYREKVTYNDDFYARNAEINKIKKSTNTDGSNSDSFIKGYENIFDYEICFLLKKHKIEMIVNANQTSSKESLLADIYECGKKKIL